MPELPEVETVRRGLEKSILHRRIIDVAITNAKVLKNQPEAVFTQRSIGSRIAQVRRRGKYLLLDLQPGDVSANSTNPSSTPFILCIHLKMRGQLRVEQPQVEVKGTDAEPKYLCVSLFLDDGRVLRFYDVWTWGETRVLTQSELAETVPALQSMGHEPLLGGPWSASDLQAKLAKRGGPIKPLLLDQTIVAGVGNIYADESLHRAGIHPQRSAKTLTPNEVERLFGTVQAVLGEAVAGGGTTSEEFGDVDGQVGRFVPRVYDRGGQPCQTCGPELAKIRLGGRGTVFCACCQK